MQGARARRLPLRLGPWYPTAVSSTSPSPVVPSEIPAHWVAHDSAAANNPAPRGYLRNLSALAEALFTTSAGPPNAARVRWLCAEVHDFVTRVGGRSRLLFRLALWLVTWLAPLFSLRPGPMRWYSPTHRARFLHRFERSFAAPLLLLVKAITSIVYYEHPEAAAEVGFDGGCFGAHTDEPPGASAPTPATEALP